MKRRFLFFVAAFIALTAGAQEGIAYRFDFSGSRKVEKNFTAITRETLYTPEQGYGYDLLPAPQGKSRKPYYFSIKVPDGNYKITLRIGSSKEAGHTTVRAESRRLLVNNLYTKKGQFIELSFTVNKRDTRINDSEKVKIKPREATKLNWDDKLTLELNGTAPLLDRLTIEKEEGAVTLFLCGNSTVVDQDNEPWASWGQMIPSFFDERICVANYAESGETATSFLAAGRLKKILSQIKEGDYIFMEFGHNDQKLKGPGIGAFYSFMTDLKIFIDEARAKGAHPVLITPTQRRNFDEKGKIVNSHLDYPDAVRWLAQKENIPLIDLHKMTATLFEALGVEGSKRAFVHYPAGSYPGQTQELKDNTHFNPYGAYEIARCVVEGMKAAGLDDITAHLSHEGGSPFNPSMPDNVKDFHWDNSPFTEVEKPDGN